MFCLARVLPLVMNPNNFPAYNATRFLETPLFNKICTEMSDSRNRLSKELAIEYQCYCNDSDIPTKLAIEKKLAEAHSLIDDKFYFQFFISLRKLNSSAVGILPYLEEVFSKREKLMELLSRKENQVPDEIRNHPINAFIMNNSELPLDEFRIKYLAFISNHLIEKFGKRLETFDDVELYQARMAFVNCVAKYHENSRDFRNLSDLLRLINAKILFIAENPYLEIPEKLNSLNW